MMRRAVAIALSAACLVAVFPASSGAQLPPAERWRTISTEHFRIHFSPGLESNARRAAVSAERAYAQLSLELAPPRGPIDLVVADNVDFTNGLATPFPSNRIVVYAHPPVSVATLRLYDDWNALVITHELAHIFHLDRSGGWWRRAQRVFGRAPFLFPNAYAPGWLTEGLAIYYESRLTGVGRLVGTEHRALARASAAEGELPWLSHLSLGTSHFPGGEGAYAYGALMLDYLARTRGAEGMRTMVDALSEQSVPFMLDRAARRGFGIGFAGAWRAWRDSVAGAAASPAAPPMDGWRELTSAGNHALHPRWMGDSSIIYSANTGREVSGAYRAGLDGRSTRVGRRNGLEPNVPLADGSLLFAQLEFDGAYRLRSDLFVQRGGREHRLTRAARLSHPDARADGAIVAVQAVPGTTRLVRVGADGRTIDALTTAALDTQWAEPRWSPRGDLIAAVRHRVGAIAEIVVLDTLGRARQVIAGGRAIFATPSWSPDGRHVLFVSDSSGRSEVYEVSAITESTSPRDRRLTSTVTTVFGPAVSPDGSLLALGVLRADGQHIGVAPYAASAEPTPGNATDGAVLPDSVPMRVGGDSVPGPGRAPSVLDAFLAIRPEVDTTQPSRRYSARRTLRPYYWLPVVQQNERDRWQFGGLTSGQDVIGRHSYFAQAHSELDGRGIDAYATYRYLGLGQPALDLAAEHDHLDYDVLRVRTYSTIVSGAATVSRPGTRQSSWIQAGAETEWFRLSQDEAIVDPGNRQHLHDTRRTLFAALGWSNARRPSFSISPEDGLSLSATVRRRWADTDGLALGTSFADEWTEVVGVTNLYKSLDLPGFAHHVLAARLAGGYSEEQRVSDFDLGGMSGSSVPLIAGSSIGGARRTFPVRGFPVGVLRGTRAAAGALEYRVPAVRGGRGIGLLPVFFDRSSITVFGDAGSAWCPEELSTTSSGVCGPGTTEQEWIASAGAEVNLDAAVLAYDAIYRIRIGAAVPVLDRRDLATQPMTGYATLGLSF